MTNLFKNIIFSLCSFEFNIYKLHFNQSISFSFLITIFSYNSKLNLFYQVKNQILKYNFDLIFVFHSVSFIYIVNVIQPLFFLCSFKAKNILNKITNQQFLIEHLYSMQHRMKTKSF